MARTRLTQVCFCMFLCLPITVHIYLHCKTNLMENLMVTWVSRVPLFFPIVHSICSQVFLASLWNAKLEHTQKQLQHSTFCPVTKKSRGVWRGMYITSQFIVPTLLKSGYIHQLGFCVHTNVRIKFSCLLKLYLSVSILLQSDLKHSGTTMYEHLYIYWVSSHISQQEFTETAWPV